MEKNKGEFKYLEYLVVNVRETRDGLRKLIIYTSSDVLRKTLQKAFDKACMEVKKVEAKLENLKNS